MTRRSFFAALAAPVVAPMIPAQTKSVRPAFIGGFLIPPGTYTTNQTITVPISMDPSVDSMQSAARAIIDAINKEVQRGSCRLTATEVKR